MKRANLLKVRKILEDIYYYGKMHGLTSCEASTLTDCYNELCKTGKTKTFQSSIAVFFEKKGFSVCFEDENRINYIITA